MSPESSQEVIFAATIVMVPKITLSAERCTSKPLSALELSVQVSAIADDDITLSCSAVGAGTVGVGVGGGGVGVAVLPRTAMLSNVPAVRKPSLWLVTASPTKTVAGKLNVTEPTSFQATPSRDSYPTNVLPVRTTRNHVGNTLPIPPAADALAEAVTERF